MHFKENDMNTVLNHSLAALAAVVLAISSIGAIVTVPPAHAAPISTATLA